MNNQQKLSTSFERFKSAFLKKGLLWFGLVVLFATTGMWSYYGAQVQMGNADQLANVYLFASPQTLHGATLPSQHTFLLKAPVLWLVSIFGSSNLAFTLATMLLSLLTVGGLAFITYKIVRRPVPFGLLCLAMAAMLLMIPPQPYAGALLPVNMAMLTTRNIEYVIFMIILILIAKLPAQKIKSWQFWTAIGGTALLIASDKLFLALTAGGAALMLSIYALLRVRPLVQFALNWLIVSAAGWLAAAGILQVLGSVITIIGDSVQPYGFVQNAHSIVLGIAYGLLGLLTNFGANPAFDATALKDIPHQALVHLLGPGGVAFAVNLLIAIFGMIFIAKYVWASRDKKHSANDWPRFLLISLLSTSVVAFIAFVATNHYYPVDARYLSVAFFALVVGLGVMLHQAKWKARKIIFACCAVFAAIVCASIAALQTYRTDNDAMATDTSRNKIVAAAMHQHHVPVLAGDYWRALPTQQLGDGGFVALPLDSCTHPRAVLSSSYQRDDFAHRPFAYLLSLDHHSPDFPNCTIEQVVSAYGKPNKSVVVAGTRDRPQELLLFYDDGAHPDTPSASPAPPATVIPVAIDQLPKPSCPGNKTIFTTVAHQDDDLLFMNPDRLHTIQQQNCIRTVYLTAGDAGSDQLYWIGREKGSEAAYDSMLGQKHAWSDNIVQLPSKQFVIIATPIGEPRISLIFMRLPDGNLTGAGFQATHYQSLAKLESGAIKTISTVSGQSTYTADDLTAALQSLMTLYAPDMVNTQAPLSLSTKYADHSDHIATGQITQIAYDIFHKTNPQSSISYYVGYPIHGLQPNVSGKDYDDKGNAFFQYAQYDPGACSAFSTCNGHTAYGEYLRRQYQYSKKTTP